MSALNDGRVALVLDKERYLLASLNALEDLQSLYGDLNELTDSLTGPNRFGIAKKVLTILLREGASDGEPTLTENQVGKLVHPANFNKAVAAIYKCFSVGTQGDAELAEIQEGEGSEKNALTAVAD